MAKFVLPSGSVVNPSFPAPVNARALTIARVADAIGGALIKAVPKLLPAGDSGHNTIAFGGVDGKSGATFVTSEMGAGGSGARADQDGIDVMDFGVDNCMNIPVEAFEMESSLRVESFRLLTDSGGCGRYRGGLGFQKTFLAVSDDVTATVRGERFYRPPWGVLGGKAAGAADAWVERASGKREQIRSKKIVLLKKGDRLKMITAGGGGYGAPIERSPQSVLDDVLDGKVGIDKARSVYGVVIDEGTVDHAATATLRASHRAAAVTLDFDYGTCSKT